MVSAKALASGLERVAITGPIAGITDAADRGPDTSLCQTLGVADRNLLPAKVAVINWSALVNGPTGIKRLFNCIQIRATVRHWSDEPFLVRHRFKRKWRRQGSVLPERDTFHSSEAFCATGSRPIPNAVGESVDCERQAGKTLPR